MTESIKKAAMLTMGTVMAIALACVTAMPGCVSASDDGDDTSTATEQTGVSSEEPDYTEVSDLMGRLVSAVTVEEANAIIGSEGVQRDEPDTSGQSTTYYYEWALPGGIGIDGTYYDYPEGEGTDSATYSVSYRSGKVKDKADFSKWDEIKTALGSKEGLSYDGMVEMLGGVEGLRSKVSTRGEVTYDWYDEDGGYLFTMVDPDGMCGTTSGRF